MFFMEIFWRIKLAEFSDTWFEHIWMIHFFYWFNLLIIRIRSHVISNFLLNKILYNVVFTFGPLTSDTPSNILYTQLLLEDLQCVVGP